MQIQMRIIRKKKKNINKNNKKSNEQRDSASRTIEQLQNPFYKCDPNINHQSASSDNDSLNFGPQNAGSCIAHLFQLVEPSSCVHKVFIIQLKYM